jgi:hypothetical protein
VWFRYSKTTLDGLYEGKVNMRDLHVRQLPRDNQTVVAHKSPACSNDSLLAISRQWNIAAACMSAVERPLSLSMADNEDAGSSHMGDV